MLDARPRRTAALLGLLAVISLACQAFEPTIQERRAKDVAPDPEQIPLSLAEEYPDILPGPPPEEEHPYDPYRKPDDDYVPPTIGDGELLQMEFREANLSQVLHFIAERAGINMVLDPFTDREVDVSFPSVTLDAALQAVLSQNGLRMVEDPPGIYSVVLYDGSQPAAASFTVQSIEAVEVEQNLKDLVTASTQVIVNGPQNLVVVLGPQSDVDAVASYLSAADRLKRQVLIEVRILEVFLDDQFELGIAAALADTNSSGDFAAYLQNLATPDDSLQFIFQSSDGTVDATINAIASLTGIELLSSPRVLALTGTEASIQVLREVPYINVTNTTISEPTTGAGTNVIEEVQFKEAGVTLAVTPTVMERGTIHCVVATTISEVVGEFNNIPVIDSREVVSDFLVGNRETVVLGGLMQNQTQEDDRGVPGLMNVPIVGRLFRSDEDRVTKRELLVFLTPRIVDRDEAALLNRALKRDYSETIRSTGVRSQVGSRR